MRDKATKEDLIFAFILDYKREMQIYETQEHVLTDVLYSINVMLNDFKFQEWYLPGMTRKYFYK